MLGLFFFCFLCSYVNLCFSLSLNFSSVPTTGKKRDTHPQKRRRVCSCMPSSHFPPAVILTIQFLLPSFPPFPAQSLKLVPIPLFIMLRVDKHPKSRLPHRFHPSSLMTKYLLLPNNRAIRTILLGKTMLRLCLQKASRILMLQPNLLRPPPKLLSRRHTNHLPIIPRVPMPVLPKTTHLLLIAQRGRKEMRVQISRRLRVPQTDHSTTRHGGASFLEAARVPFLDHPHPSLVIPTPVGRHGLLATARAPIDLVAVEKVLAGAVLELDGAAEGHGVVYCC